MEANKNNPNIHSNADKNSISQTISENTENQSEESFNAINNSHLYQLLIQYGWQHKMPFIVAVLLTVFASFINFFIPQINRYVIDVIIPEKQFNMLPWVGIVILLMTLVSGVLLFFQLYAIKVFGYRTIDSIRTDLYKHVQYLSIGFFENQRTGELMCRLAKDVDTVGDLVSANLIAILIDSFAFVVVFTYIIFSNWLLAIALIVYLLQFSQRKLEIIFQYANQKADLLSNHLQDTIANIKIIKSFGNESYEIKRFAEFSHHDMEANLQATWFWSIFVPIINILNQLGNLIVLVFGAWEVMVNRLTIGELAALLTYVTLLNRPINRFNGLLDLMQKAVVSAQRIFAVLETKLAVSEKQDATHLVAVKGNLQFEDVGFSYPNSETVIHHFSLEIKPGMSVALVGSSGAGKSTIAKLAVRFYDPQQGKILIDGHNLRDVKLGSLRSHIGIVPQETLLLYGTVQDNIAYGKLDATTDEIEAAAKAANAHDFIINFPEGYQSIIGEQGVKLSGGQRQRIAIARVLLKNPQIIILDEATSALDSESEQLIQASVKRLFQNRTSIVIAHRLSTICHVDRIVVLEKGEIVETGTHAELIARGGRYADLYGLQLR